MKCPVCKDVTLLMMDKKGIEIDYCPECRGVWLDRGELEKLVQAEKSYDKNTFENDDEDDRKKHNNHGSNNNHSGHNKKKSFLDGFDFFD